MRYFFDTEFIDDGRTIDLISIGMVREDGRELYCVSNEFDSGKAGSWVVKNVFPKLGADVGLSRGVIRNAILGFVVDKPEFWGYYSSYDWVALCQLFGTMMDIPKGWPMLCLDLKQWWYQLGMPELPQAGNDEHNALADARWNKKAWEFLREYESRRQKINVLN